MASPLFPSLRSQRSKQEPEYARLPSSAGGTPTAGGGTPGGGASRRRVDARLARALGGVATLALAAVLLNCGVFTPVDPALAAWSTKGCPTKILDLTTTMEANYKSAVAAGLDPELGAPVLRKPKTAILNFVRYHTEVVAATAFHFVKLRHNVTIFSRDDEFGMVDVMHPYFWKGFRKFERFFEHFHEYDTVVVATFPTCHDPTLRELLRLRLPQRVIALVHNPELLNNTGMAQLIAENDVRVLAISPHVGAYARQVLEAQGVKAELDWIAPMMPVIFPEDCVQGDWRMEHPACNRTERWREVAPPPELADPSLPRSFCIQGKVDPARRAYPAIFAEITAHREELLARNFSLTILGKAAGPSDSSLVTIPPRLLADGLVRHYEYLPFQEYYEVLHACLAVVPAFADDAYYVNKGSSSVGAALIAGTPVVASRFMLKSYDFLEEAAVYLADEPMSDVEAMLWVLGQGPALHTAKRAALGALRRAMYERNLQVLQRLLGEQYMYHRRVRSGPQKGQYVPFYIDLTTDSKPTTAIAAVADGEGGDEGNEDGAGDDGEGDEPAAAEASPEGQAAAESKATAGKQSSDADAAAAEEPAAADDITSGDDAAEGAAPAADGTPEQQGAATKGAESKKAAAAAKAAEAPERRRMSEEQQAAAAAEEAAGEGRRRRRPRSMGRP